MSEPDKNLIKVEPGTLLLVILTLLLVPLLITGFVSH